MLEWKLTDEYYEMDGITYKRTMTIGYSDPGWYRVGDDIERIVDDIEYFHLESMRRWSRTT